MKTRSSSKKSPVVEIRRRGGARLPASSSTKGSFARAADVDDSNVESEVESTSSDWSSSSESVNTASIGIKSVENEKKESTTTTRKWWKLPATVTYLQAPVYLRDNEYILTGYRTGYSFVQCALSFFSQHNELTNMWSHGLGVLIFGLYMAALIMWLLRSLVPGTGLLDDGLRRANVEDVVILGIYYVCGSVCMLTSTLYHTFSAHSEESMVFFIRCDLSGIAALVSGSLVVPVYYIYYCRPFMRAVYLMMAVGFLVAGVSGPQFPAFHTTQMRGLRAILYGGMAVSGSLPTLHSLFVLELHECLTMYTWIGGMYAMYGIGLLFYIFRFPECRWPGTFDTWFPSHTWWHIFVLAGALVHAGFCWWIYELRAINGCPVEDSLE